MPCIPFQGVFHSATLYKLSINAIKQPTTNIDRTNHQNKRKFQTLFLLRAAHFFWPGSIDLGSWRFRDGVHTRFVFTRTVF